MTPNDPPSFDGQAGTYDERAGLPDHTCRLVADNILALAKLAPDALILEVCAGTGLIGRWLAREPYRYLGFDLSHKMLSLFRHRTKQDDRLRIVQADGNESWPVEDKSCGLIFCSRAIHLLHQQRVLEEVRRVSAPGAVFLTGIVKREGTKRVMRAQMRKLLAEKGYQGRVGEKRAAGLVQDLETSTTEALGPLVAAQWQTHFSPAQALQKWRAKEGLGGREIPSQTQAEILDALEVWARHAYADLDQPLENEESYILEGIRMGTH